MENIETKSKKSTFVSIVIPVYNGQSFLKKLLLAIKDQTYKNYQVIAVDNKSTDDSVKILESFKDIIPLKIIDNQKNDGYSGGCNTGIKNSDGELFLFLSQDRIISPDWLSKAIPKIQSNQEIGCVFGKVIVDETTYSEYGGIYDMYGSPCMKGSPETSDLFYAGGCILVKKSVIDKIGMFDQKFFMYQEDIDLCWRMHLAGYCIHLVDEIECKNIGGGVSNTFYVEGKLFVNFDSELIQMPVYRFYHSIVKNRIRIVLKNYSLKNIIQRLPVIMILILLRGTLMTVKSKNFSYVSSAFKGVFWNIINIKDTLMERRRIQSFRIVDEKIIVKKMIKRSIEWESLGKLRND